MAEILAALESGEQLQQFGQLASRYGHRVIGARDIKRAQDLLQLHKIDAVVAPVDFEGGQILTFLRAVKAQAVSGSPLFVFFAEVADGTSSQRVHQLRMAVRALGADKLVTFPKFHAAELWWQLAVCLPDNRN